MRPRHLSTSTESTPAPQRSRNVASEEVQVLYARDLPNATIQPFKMWQPPRLKTGLRNQPIGRKVAITA
jgi:hypothetical protein